jgi:heme exporter protein A
MTPERSDPNPARIVIRGLSKKYHFQPVLDDLSLSIDDGDLCILVGANGAGKSTLLRIIAALVRPDAGEVVVGDSFIESNASARCQIGYLGHQSLFYNDLNAVENLTHYARLYRLNDIPAEVVRSIESVGLAAHQHKPVRTYSRGMQQRLAIARTLLHNPSVLLLDEPYTGLDKEAAEFLDERLQQLHQPGRAILIAAHHPQRLLPVASHIAWLRDGRIATHLSVNRLGEAPELQDYLQEAR